MEYEGLTAALLFGTASLVVGLGSLLANFGVDAVTTTIVCGFLAAFATIFASAYIFNKRLSCVERILKIKK